MQRGNATLVHIISRRRSGFTLIELLVVVAIISLLVSILLPSLNRAKELARAVICQTTLKQVAACAGYYFEDHDGRMPKGDPRGGRPSTHWFYMFFPYIIPGSYINDNGEFIDPDGNRWSSCRQQGVELYDCATVSVEGRDGWEVWPDYKLNGYYGLYATNAWKLGVPSESVFLCERDYGNWHVTPAVFPPVPNSIKPPAARHSGNANVLWADLHVDRYNAEDLGVAYELWNWD
jgi:prepilin-type N-terminal cleavage/methylation domain-containing protein/prepilin-type processing-associated H-X9-DG protein